LSCPDARLTTTVATPDNSGKVTVGGVHQTKHFRHRKLSWLTRRGQPRGGSTLYLRRQRLGTASGVKSAESGAQNPLGAVLVGEAGFILKNDENIGFFIVSRTRYLFSYLKRGKGAGLRKGGSWGRGWRGKRRWGWRRGRWRGLGGR